MRITVVIFCATFGLVACEPVPYKFTTAEEEFIAEIGEEWPEMTREEFDEMEAELQDLWKEDEKSLLAGPKPEKPADLPEFDEDDAAAEVEEMNIDLPNIYFEGDILLTKEQAKEMKEARAGAQKRKVVSSEYYKWPNNHIDFILDDSLAQDKAVIRAATKFWQDNTCLTFKENGAGNKIKFYRGRGCFSNLGYVADRKGGIQAISIKDAAYCRRFGTVTHEIGHALGFFHEHNRNDRDNSVRVDMSAIPSHINPRNYAKVDANKMINYGPYDLGAVMQYPSSRIIVSVDENYQETMGNRRQPAFLDIYAINKHYKCDSRCEKVTSKPSCKHGGYADPNNCQICKCPDGFGGADCSSRQPDVGKTCGSSLTATDDWKVLSANEGTPDLTDQEISCYWHIQAPENKKIEVQITMVDGPCLRGCTQASLQIKMQSDFRLAGYTQCCDDTKNLNKVWESATNTVPVILHANNAIKFSLKYRLVGGVKPTATTTEAPDYYYYY